MSSLTDRIHSFIDADDAQRLLAKYYVAGNYTGATFDLEAQLASPDPNRLTPHDLAAVATLSVPLSGRAVVALIDASDAISEGLRRLPTELDLVDADDDVLEAIWELQAVLDPIADVGHVRRSKLLAHKRPRLIPIRDRYVLTALTGRSGGSFTQPLRDALVADPSIGKRLDELREHASLPDAVSKLRVLDVVVWMATHGDDQVED